MDDYSDNMQESVSNETGAELPQDNSDMYYEKEPLNDDSIPGCHSYGAGESHREIIEQAGGEIGYDGFQDPRAGKDGPITADRYFIDNKNVNGINFNDRDGNFAVAYTGLDYADIKDSNLRDCANKK